MMQWSDIHWSWLELHGNHLTFWQRAIITHITLEDVRGDFSRDDVYDPDTIDP